MYTGRELVQVIIFNAPGFFLLVSWSGDVARGSGWWRGGRAVVWPGLVAAACLVDAAGGFASPPRLRVFWLLLPIGPCRRTSAWPRKYSQSGVVAVGVVSPDRGAWARWGHSNWSGGGGGACVAVFWLFSGWSGGVVCGGGAACDGVPRHSQPVGIRGGQPRLVGPRWLGVERQRRRWPAADDIPWSRCVGNSSRRGRHGWWCARARATGPLLLVADYGVYATMWAIGNVGNGNGDPASPASSWTLAFHAYNGHRSPNLVDTPQNSAQTTNDTHPPRAAGPPVTTCSPHRHPPLCMCTAYVRRHAYLLHVGKRTGCSKCNSTAAHRIMTTGVAPRGRTVGCGCARGVARGSMLRKSWPRGGSVCGAYPHGGM